MDLSSISTCQDLCEDVFALAAASRDDAYKLLNHVSAICEPHSGEQGVLLFLARCALQPWVDGDLRVEIRLEGMYECRLTLMCGLGGDAFEVMKRVTLAASFLVFKQLADDPAAIAPFEVADLDSKRIVLDAIASSRAQSIPPAEFPAAQQRLAEKFVEPSLASDSEDARSLAGDSDAPEPPGATHLAGWVQPHSSVAPEDLPLVEPTDQDKKRPSPQPLARVVLARARRPLLAAIEVQPEVQQDDDGKYRPCGLGPRQSSAVAAAAEAKHTDDESTSDGEKAG